MYLLCLVNDSYPSDASIKPCRSDDEAWQARLISSMSPTSDFCLLSLTWLPVDKIWEMGVFLSQNKVRTSVWKMWGRCLSQSWNKVKAPSQTLRESILDFKAIDRLFLWANPSVLTSNPVCIELCPSSRLFLVRQNWSLILHRCYEKEAKWDDRRRKTHVRHPFFPLSCFHFFLVDCFASTFIVYLTWYFFLLPSVFQYHPFLQLLLRSRWRKKWFSS